MNISILKKSIRTAAYILLLGFIAIFAAACAPSAASQGNKIASIMQNERDTDSTIQHNGVADKLGFGEGNSLYDDLWEYVYSPDGYIISAIRAHDKKIGRASCRETV